MIVPQGLDKAYQNFFIKSEHGKYFLDIVHEEIDSEHRRAENDPDKSAAHTQRAKGLRFIEDHINSVAAERSKPE